MQIWKEYNKKLKRQEWRVRFRYNGKQFRLKHDTKDDLLTLIAEVRRQESAEKANKKFGLNLEVVSYVPTAKEIFDETLPTIPKPHQKVLCKRVFESFLGILPALIKVDQLKKSHFQLYINHRTSQLGKSTKKPVKLQTVLKEIYAVKSALKAAILKYDSLENWQTPELPKPPKGFKRKTRRERLVSDRELMTLIDELMKAPKRPQETGNIFHRVRLAHQIEFAYWTGLRRKEITRLKFSQFDKDQQALLNVRRWKTDSVTKFFPLGKRAIEIIESRRELQNCDFIFSPDGEPIEANYRTLKKICKDLNITYGAFIDGGFVAHDLRHNFGTEILRETDIETARELLGHSNITQTGTYVHTSNDRLREAVRKRDKIDYDGELGKVFDQVKTEKLDKEKFTAEIKKLFGF